VSLIDTTPEAGFSLSSCTPKAFGAGGEGWGEEARKPCTIGWMCAVMLVIHRVGAFNAGPFNRNLQLETLCQVEHLSE